MENEVFRLLLESGDEAQREAAALDLGRHLANGAPGDWLRQARRTLARQTKTARDDLERGFLLALELVTAGFERQSIEARADESELVRIRSRAHWLPALQFLQLGSQRPSDLAERLGIGKSHATKLLDELEAAELVTRASEGRERPCSLTARARVLLDKLPAAPSPDLEHVVPAVVDCLGTIARDRRVGRARLLSELQRQVAPKAAPHVLELLTQAMQASSFGFVDTDDMMVAVDVELQSRLGEHLKLACAGTKTALVTRLAGLSDGSRIVLRVPNGSYEWDVVAKRHLPGVDVVSDGLPDQAFAPPTEPYQVVYGSPSLVIQDRRRGRASLAERASHRYCFGVDTSPTIPNFVAIDVPIPELAARVPESRTLAG